MSHIECIFQMTDFQLDSVIGEDDHFFLNMWGESIALELDALSREDLDFLLGEIEAGLRLSEKEVQECRVEELLYQPPAPVPLKLIFHFGLGGLQALYQPPDHLWEMVFDDDAEDGLGSQGHVMMSTAQVESFLRRLKEAGARAESV